MNWIKYLTTFLLSLLAYLQSDFQFYWSSEAFIRVLSCSNFLSLMLEFWFSLNRTNPKILHFKTFWKWFWLLARVLALGLILDIKFDHIMLVIFFTRIQRRKEERNARIVTVNNYHISLSVVLVKELRLSISNYPCEQKYWKFSF